MDVELNVISKALVEGDIKPMLDAKITPDFFVDEQYSEVWQWISEYWSEYGEVPTHRVVRRHHPSFEPAKGVHEPYQYYVDQLRERREYGILVEALADAGEFLKDGRDNKAALARLVSGITQVGTEVTVSRDTDLTKTWEERIGVYESLKGLKGGLRGIPTGFSSLDRATSGLQPEQLVTFIGEPKAGKSTMMMKAAIVAHEYGKTPLLITYEMSNREQEARHDAMVAGIDHLKLTQGRLSKSEEVKLFEALKARQSMHPFLLSSDITGATTVPALESKVEQYAPDILFVDGVYLMDDVHGQDKGSPQALTNITRDLKRMAQKRRIPVIISTQVLTWKMSRKKGLTGDSIGYSSSFAQDSDVIIGVENTDDEDIKKVRVVMSRSGPLAWTEVNWDWGTSSFEEMDYDPNAEDEDDDDSF